MENRVILIIRNRKFTIQLQNILRFIALDKRSAAIDFQHDLDAKFQLLKTQPMMGRMSQYADDENVRDLIHNGYTIVYEIKDEQTIRILEVFKWQDK
ncbi:type II toxin-antitoxin system RelE/ParE family toxin [Sulfuricurvum sp.]|uniref:type II toxin-antitoxin system RelE/ParE family toxin n=1 Tax=Sulfuricurvum sp. TaxID=2025608 RepID=UPI003C567FB5